MDLILNGKAHSSPLSTPTLLDLLTSLKKDPQHVIVEHNGTLYKYPYPAITLRPNDRIEIIHFMGGG